MTDQSDMEQLDEVSRAERRTQSRRSWMPTSPTRKRHNTNNSSSNEQVGLGLAAAASPPLGATNPGADRSTSSIGSWHQASRSSPSDLQQFVNDPANQQPLSLDAEVSNNNAAAKDIGTEQPERRSLFGKFKAKVGLSRDSRDAGGGGSSERTKSPATSEGPWKSGSSLALSPPPTSREPMGRTTPVEGTRNEETVQSPVSPQLGSSMPPAIPEEPSPTVAAAAPTAAATEGAGPVGTDESSPVSAETAPETAPGTSTADSADPASAASDVEQTASAPVQEATAQGSAVQGAAAPESAAPESAPKESATKESAPADTA